MIKNTKMITNEAALSIKTGSPWSLPTQGPRGMVFGTEIKVGHKRNCNCLQFSLLI